MIFKSDKQISNFLLIAILVFATVLRFYHFNLFSLSNDELSALSRLHFSSFSEMITKGVMIDFHPAGVQIFLFYWTNIFGVSEFVLRLPFVISGIGSVYLIYLISKKWFNVTTGLFVAATWSVLEFPLLYSQIARPYSPGLFFSLLATYCWTKIFFNKIKNENDENETKIHLKFFIGFVLSVSACMYIHYFALLQAGILCIAGLFFLTKENFKKYIFSGIAILILYIPHLKIFFHQMSIGGIGGSDGWLGKPESDFLFQYLVYAFNNSYLLIFLFSLTTICTVFIFKSVLTKNKFRLLSFLFFILPFLIGYYYSIYRNPVLQYSVLLFSFPFFIFLIFSFVANSIQSKITIAGVVIILLLGSFSTVVQEKYYATQHFGVFKELAEKTLEFNTKYGRENITKTINIINPYYIDYYFQKFHHDEKFESYMCNDYTMINDFAKIIEQSKSKYFLHAWSNTFDPPELDDVIRTQFPYMIQNFEYFNSGIKLYSKYPEEAIASAKPVYEMLHDFEISKWANDSVYFNDSVFHSGKQAVFMNEKNEYGPTFLLPQKNAELKKGEVIKISLWYYPLQEQLSAKLVFSIDNKDKSEIWMGREFKIYQTKVKQWQQIFLTYKIATDLKEDQMLKAYVWNDKKESFFIDDFKFQIVR